MHPFFKPLTEREAALLLVTLMVGGAHELSLFSYLSSAQVNILNEKAKILQDIAAPKRIKFMAKELKQALLFQGQQGLEKIEPSWILHALRGESPRIVFMLLMSLPPHLAESIKQGLPPGIKTHLPPKEEALEVQEVLLTAIRQIFARRFAPMPVDIVGPFTFKDLVHLERLELFNLMRDLGLLELGQAFVSIGKMALADLCRRLPRKEADELIEAVASVSKIDLPDKKTSQHFLSKIVANFDDTEQFLQKAGLWRLAKAFVLEAAPARLAFSQRITRGAAAVFNQYLAKAEEMYAAKELTEELLKRLQTGILGRLKELAHKGVIAKKWADIVSAT